MAKVILSPLVNKVSGPIGPMSFFMSQGVNVLRTRGKGQPKVSPALAAVHATYGRLFELYESLPAFPLSSWYYRALDLNLSGWNLFVQNNLAIEKLNPWAAGTPETSSHFPPIPPITSVVTQTGTGPGECLIKWNYLDFSSMDHWLYILARKANTNKFTFAQWWTYRANQSGWAMVTLDPNTVYHLSVSVHNAPTLYFGKGLTRSCLSGS